MTVFAIALLASFTTPMRIGTTPASVLWLLPLVATISIVYKATKVGSIRLRPFAKETAGLFGSILVFILVAAVILYGVAWIVTGQLPGLLDRSAF
ncbi:MAG: hypothetical protein KBE65_04995 [Phycisphaerae bacterium]|nr:hypothetical protein [Phycisphaerae bacterium]